jgi:hypothetical protein
MEEALAPLVERDNAAVLAQVYQVPGFWLKIAHPTSLETALTTDPFFSVHLLP